jgi:pterin-4a-carbinolamine dehydratase
VNSGNYVRLELHTHDDGGVVTQKDRELARAIDVVVGG